MKKAVASIQGTISVKMPVNKSAYPIENRDAYLRFGRMVADLKAHGVDLHYSMRVTVAGVVPGGGRGEGVLENLRKAGRAERGSPESESKPKPKWDPWLPKLGSSEGYRRNVLSVMKRTGEQKKDTLGHFLDVSAVPDSEGACCVMQINCPFCGDGLQGSILTMPMISEGLFDGYKTMLLAGRRMICMKCEVDFRWSLGDGVVSMLSIRREELPAEWVSDSPESSIDPGMVIRPETAVVERICKCCVSEVNRKMYHDGILAGKLGAGLLASDWLNVYADTFPGGPWNEREFRIGCPFCQGRVGEQYLTEKEIEVAGSAFHALGLKVKKQRVMNGEELECPTCRINFRWNPHIDDLIMTRSRIQ